MESTQEGGYQQGDARYVLANMGRSFTSATGASSNEVIGNLFGMRAWAQGAFKAKIYFIDIAKGLPLDFTLPSGNKVRDVIKSTADGGNWDPDKPFRF